MPKKAFPPARGSRSSSRRALPHRVLAAAGLADSASLARDSRASGVRTGSHPRAPGPPWPIVLGIDPGTIAVGYGAVEAAALGPRFLVAGVLRPRRRAGVPERLGEIQAAIVRLLEEVRPSVVVVERAFASRNVQSALRIGEGRGVALACAAAFGSEVVEMPPASAKKSLVGDGSADKSRVARMVAMVLGLREPPRPLDATDALALALAHLFQRVHWLRDGGAARQGGTRVAARGVRSRSSDVPA